VKRDAGSRIVVAAAVLAGLIAGSSCAHRRAVRTDYGIPHCIASAADALLSADALQCWFDARHGRWRILSHVSLYDALVVEIETVNLRDVEEIATRFAAGERERFSEILVYARPESPASSSKVRRVRWTRGGGFEVLEYPAPGRS
jgi:hypothetical protein